MWRRSKDAVPILLTFGETVYVKDARISIRETCNEDLKQTNENFKTAFQYEGTCDWTLALMHSKLSDGGTYECHISTEPPQILKTNLLVQGKQGVMKNVKFNLSLKAGERMLPPFLAFRFRACLFRNIKQGLPKSLSSSLPLSPSIQG